MILRPLLLLALFALALPAGAQTLPPGEADAPAALASSPRHGEWVTVPGAAGDRFQAWVVYPQRPDPAPVVVLIHEIFGLTDWARAVADAYAAEGFVVIAPDFLSGKAPDGQGGSQALGPEAARGAISRLDPAEIAARLNASAQWATALPSATRAYGVVGFCWGGGIAYGWATAQPGLKAAVGYYGTAPALGTVSRVQAAVLALYGGNDNRVTSTLGPFRDAMAQAQKTFEAEVYEGAGHAFLRQQQGQGGANLRASQQAWPRTVAFLKAHLEAPKLVSMADEDCLECADLPAFAPEVALGR